MPPTKRRSQQSPLRSPWMENGVGPTNQAIKPQTPGVRHETQLDHASTGFVRHLVLSRRSSCNVSRRFQAAVLAVAVRGEDAGRPVALRGSGRFKRRGLMPMVVGLAFRTAVL